MATYAIQVDDSWMAQNLIALHDALLLEDLSIDALLAITWILVQTKEQLERKTDVSFDDGDRIDQLRRIGKVAVEISDLLEPST